MNYDDFRLEYEKQHPASVPTMDDVMSVSRIVLAVVLVMFVTAALLSGVHTVPLVHAGIPDSILPFAIRRLAAYGSFVAIELAILVSAYMMVRDNRWFALLMFGMAMTAATTANVVSVRSALSGDGESLIVAVIIGITAPVIALASGKMLVNMTQDSHDALAEARASLLDASRKWDKTILSEYRKAEKGSDRPSVSVRPGQQRTRPQVSKKDAVRTHLAKFPDDIQKSTRVLSNELGVSKSVVHEVKQEYSNGGPHE